MCRVPQSRTQSTICAELQWWEAPLLLRDSWALLMSPKQPLPPSLASFWRPAQLPERVSFARAFFPSLSSACRPQLLQQLQSIRKSDSEQAKIPAKAGSFGAA